MCFCQKKLHENKIEKLVKRSHSLIESELNIAKIVNDLKLVRTIMTNQFGKEENEMLLDKMENDEKNIINLDISSDEHHRYHHASFDNHIR